MIKEKTVFVFGAGLSKSYGFPTNSELRDNVIGILSNGHGNANIPERIRILRNMGYEFDEIKQVRSQLARGGFDTVDEFLENRKNPKYRSLAKTAIAMALILCENPEMFDRGNSTTDFYRFLFKKMYNDADEEKFSDNRISIITYNYDRSFEQYLWGALKNFYDIMPQEVDNIISKIKIIHIHGMLGFMPWQSTKYREYRNVLDESSVALASEGIVNFDEIEKTHKGYTSARNEIKEAENVIFVGFGFHQLNLSRLIEGNVLDDKKRISGTRVGIGDNQMEEIKRISQGKITEGHLHPEKAVQFAQKHLTWL